VGINAFVISHFSSLTDKARDLFNEGVSLFKKGEYGRARASFLAAWALKKHYQVGARLGECELKLGMHRDAAEHLAFGIREAVRLGEDVGAARKLLEEAKGKIGALEIRVSEAGAEVLVDGVVVGSAPLADAVFVEPGKHTIEARREEKRAKIEVDAAMGAAVPVELALVAPKRELKEETRRNGTTLPPPATPIPERSIVPAIVLGGVALAGLAGGIGFTVASNARSDDRSSLIEQLGDRSACWEGGAPGPTCTEVTDASAAEQTFRGLAVASFVTGGVALGASLIYALWPSEHGDGKAVARVVPAPTAQGGGLVIVGAF
jgi:hypothetical protein